MPETQLPGDGTSGPDTEAPFTPKGPINEMWAARPHWVRRGEAFFHVLRVKFAHAVLLPELSPDQAYDLRQTVRQEGQLTHGYVLMCALAAGIAILGLLQSSTAVVIGAMLVSPLMSPIAAMGFGFASLDGHRIRDSIRVVAIGAGIGIATGIVLTWLSPIRNATPEILARTEPNLLDLAVALFSGIAGGYSTVIGKGGTAIGVAIATALMPPLTVIGYGIGVLQPMFALGALLLFLTNLAAITFAFALIARLSGAARPFGKVEWTPRYATILVAAFLALATPLTMTLMKLTNEARIRSAAQEAIIAACGERGVTIAQLDVSSSLLGSPKVKALVIATSYTGNARSPPRTRSRKPWAKTSMSPCSRCSPPTCARRRRPWSMPRWSARPQALPPTFRPTRRSARRLACDPLDLDRPRAAHGLSRARPRARLDPGRLPRDREGGEPGRQRLDGAPDAPAPAAAHRPAGGERGRAGSRGRHCDRPRHLGAPTLGTW